MRGDDHPKAGGSRFDSYFRFRFGAWVRAEAAAVLAVLDDLGSRNTLEAADAAFFPVFSFPTINHLLF